MEKLLNSHSPAKKASRLSGKVLRETISRASSLFSPKATRFAFAPSQAHRSLAFVAHLV